MLNLHIAAGLVAILAGFIALFSRKGENLHRRGGRAFVVTMVLMLAIGAFMAFFVVGKHADGLGALFTIYLVATSLVTITRRVEEVRGITRGFAAFAFALGATYLATVPAPQSLLFAAGTFACGASDLRMLARGSIAGAERLKRHLWRMTFALGVATASFFLGQADVLPESMQNFALLSIPVLTVLAALAYWLLRLRTRKGIATIRAG